MVGCVLTSFFIFFLSKRYLILFLSHSSTRLVHKRIFLDRKTEIWKKKHYNVQKLQTETQFAQRIAIFKLKTNYCYSPENDKGGGGKHQDRDLNVNTMTTCIKYCKHDLILIARNKTYRKMSMCSSFISTWSNKRVSVEISSIYALYDTPLNRTTKTYTDIVHWQQQE